MEESDKCYLCDKSESDNFEDLFATTTKYSNTLTYAMLQKIAHNELIKPVNTNRTTLICSDCLRKLNKYDLAVINAERLQKELLDILRQGSEKYYETIGVYNESKNEVIIDGVSYLVKTDIETTTKYGELFEEETDEYEIRFFTTDADDGFDNNSQPVVENDEVQEDNDAQETEEPQLLVEIRSEAAETGNEIKRKLRSRKTSCKICNLEFKSQKELSNHNKVHTNDEERFVCDICGNQYKTKPALSIHIDLHNGISPFECEICGKKFTQKGALKRHLPIHTGERPYQCHKCGKQFIHYSSFHMHNLAHDNIRDKKCGVCGLKLRSSSHLNRHMLVHTGQKPHACPKCGQRFAQRYNMMSHFRSHQGIQRKKKHICVVCNRGFAKEILLEKHMQGSSCKPAENHITDVLTEHLSDEIKHSVVE